MNQTSLVDALGEFFEVEHYHEPDLWSSLPEDYRHSLARYAAPNLKQEHINGLVLDNTATIERVYLAVFPNQTVLDKAIAREVKRGAPGALLFIHHLLAYDPDAGYMPIPEAQLADLRDQNISLYLCHTPLQCHPEISTGGALADALRLRDQSHFSLPDDAHCTGVWGRVNAMPFQRFVQRIVESCETLPLRYDQIRHNGKPIEQIGVAPGLIEQPDLLIEAHRAGCDTFISGQWWPYGEHLTEARATVAEFVAGLDMNLIGIGNYESKLIVMRDAMRDWFKNLRVETQLLRQTEDANVS